MLEFLVPILGGLPNAKDISKAAQPLDQDQAVGKAWGVEGWADCSGISRTMHTLTETQGEQYATIVDRALQPWIDQEVQLAKYDLVIAKRASGRPQDLIDADLLLPPKKKNDLQGG